VDKFFLWRLVANAAQYKAATENGLYAAAEVFAPVGCLTGNFSYKSPFRFKLTAFFRRAMRPPRDYFYPMKGFIMSDAAEISATQTSAPQIAAAPAGNQQPQVSQYQETIEIDPNALPVEPPPSMLNSPWFLVAIAGIWMLFIWTSRRNSKKQEQKRREELGGIARGDRVVTIGRMHGVVVGTTDKTFTVRPDPNKDYQITFDREAVLRVENNKKDGDKEVEGAAALAQPGN
jgi:preprotein translocase subunit YajC